MKLIKFECDECGDSIEDPEEMLKVEIKVMSGETTTEGHFHPGCWNGIEDE